MRLSDHFYAYFWQGYGNNCNSYIYRGAKTVLIDPGHIVNEAGERCFDILTRSMAADGIRLENIELILCTHGHPDHVEAAGLIRERSGARLAIHREDAFFLEGLEQRLAARGLAQKVSLTPVFYLQAGDLHIEQPEGGADTIRVLHTPATRRAPSAFTSPGEGPCHRRYRFPQQHRAFRSSRRESGGLGTQHCFPGPPGGGGASPARPHGPHPGSGEHPPQF